MRNEIYELSLPSEEDTPRLGFDERRGTEWSLAGNLRLGERHIQCDKGGDASRVRDGRVRYPALLVTSHQIRHETLSIFLSRATVVVALNCFMSKKRLELGEGAPLAKAWLVHIGQERASMINQFIFVGECMPRNGASGYGVLETLGFADLGLRKEVIEVHEYRRTTHVPAHGAVTSAGHASRLL